MEVRIIKLMKVYVIYKKSEIENETKKRILKS